MFEDISEEQLIVHFQNKNFNYILNNFCKKNNNELTINYLYFKYLGNQDTYDLFTSVFVDFVDSILSKDDFFIVHISIKKMSVMEIKKHITFIRDVSNLLKQKYQNKMKKCYIYNASNVFSQIYDIISKFVDKDTQQKIELI